MKKLRFLFFFIIPLFFILSCAPQQVVYYLPQVRDNKSEIWSSKHPRVAAFHKYYSNTRTVRVALQKGKKYLPSLVQYFRKRGLPEQLAYLPMLESLFGNRANSGHARGLWQFTRQTGKHMGLRIGFGVDERMNWEKSTKAAANYLETLGKQFNYNWALALSAYNGGPNYIKGQIKSQRTWDFFKLQLRKETFEYVPRFIAMLQVAREKYPHLMPSGPLRR